MLNKKFQEKKTLFSDLNLRIDDGEIIELSGKNGVGKTTLLSMIGGLEQFSGFIKFKGYDLKNDYIGFISHVAFISNNPFMFDYMTVNEMTELISEFVDADHLWKEKLNELFELLGLNQYREVLVKNLSFGTVQKVSIFLSLLSKPDLLLLDEPFVNIDAGSVEVLKSFFKEYVSDHQAVFLYASHDVTVAKNFATKFIRLEEKNGISIAVIS